ncbi:hypothetical protein [Acinetobacter baumannii]|uniref:hypothetical protein n=1 Tax=Acinetobacter baumannii TaxID=470 RepID=UPI001D1734B1|nr:hypothetical protein [Acinetobacter baumannii]
MKNSKHEKFIVVVFWGVVAYAMALLTFCTFKNFYNLSADFISAFGSILGACAAIFAAFVAAYLFNDWKTSANFEQNKEIIDKFESTYIETKIILVSLKDRAILASAQSSTTRVELFDSVSASLTKLYYLQQKLEHHFNINQEDILWTELESILAGYINLLEFKTPYNQIWFKNEAMLISRLNTIHTPINNALMNLNPIKD